MTSRSVGPLLFILGLSFASCKKDKEAPEVVINSFTDHAQGGATIIITGSGFSDKIAENTVTINDQPAIVTAAAPNSLSVTVPAKAGNGKIKVTVRAKSTLSENIFTYDWVHMVSTLAGDGTTENIHYPLGLVADGKGNLYFADELKHRVMKVSSNGTVTTLAGSGDNGFKDGNGTNAQFNGPTGLAIDAAGNLYVADRGNHRIRMISPGGDVSTWAGNETIADLDRPTGLAFDGAGNLIIADQGKSKVIRITPNPDGSRTFSTVAGSTMGFEDGNAATAKFDWLIDVAVDVHGNIYVADLSNNRIRKITPGGIVTTVAGNGSSEILQSPIGIDLDPKGDLYISDQGNARIRKLSFASDGTGTIATIAGGESGYADGIGTTAKFANPLGLAIDKNGIIYLGDGSMPRIRKIELQ